MEQIWNRVSKNKPCPICGKNDWCLIASDGSSAICPRIESGKRAGEAGYLHIIKKSEFERRPSRIFIKPKVHPKINPKDLIQLSRQYQGRAEALNRIERLSDELGVSPESLRRLGVGWDLSEDCWTFPLTDAAGRIVGLNRRFKDASKKLYFGHRAGLYIQVDLPNDLTNSSLLITEGGSDTAAALDLGFWTIGRFNCQCGADMLRKLIRRRCPGRVVIIADGDTPGQRGAERLACHLIPYVRELKIITPPEKDLRSWLLDGADHFTLCQLIHRTEPAKLQLVIGGDRCGR